MKKNRAFLTALTVGAASLLSLGLAKADSVYVGNYFGDTVSVINTDTNSITTFGNTTTTDGPTGLAYDPLNGLVYIANAGNGEINTFTTAGVYQGTFFSGLVDPQGLAFDSAGNLYVANETPGQITKITPGGSSSIFASASSLDYPDGLVFDGSGNLFVSNAGGTGQGAVDVITPGGFVNTLNYTGATVTQPTGIAFDSAGNLYVVSFPTGTVQEITPGNVSKTVPISGLNEPEDIAFDSEGNLWINEAGDNTVAEFNPITGQLENSYTNTIDGPGGILILPDSGPLPIPEPSTYALLFAGMGVLFFYNRRRKLAQL